MKKWTSLLLACFIAGCATHPDDIKPAYISPLQYQHYDCSQLALEAQRISQRIQELYFHLKKRADSDAFMMTAAWLVFWPSLFFIQGDKADTAEYARLKGEYEAVQKAAIEKHCTFDMPPFEELVKSKNQQTTSNPGGVP